MGEHELHPPDHWCIDRKGECAPARGITAKRSEVDCFGKKAGLKKIPLPLSARRRHIRRMRRGP